MVSILKDFEARQLEIDEDEQLEVVEEEEEDWDPQDELVDVERQASRGIMITFSGGTLVSEERVRTSSTGFRLRARNLGERHRDSLHKHFVPVYHWC
ncbi:unnamed protein product [Heligmosomoides polygyrus]|uniref:Spt5-NGN domain-containing protein n=1 Tax=Heligmosomoides polygyrus TaxID=6339 RepID=A0A183FYL5_HELPZ|nr:unnamed protein product [Heligmosomoides polygyrus]